MIRETLYAHQPDGTTAELLCPCGNTRNKIGYESCDGFGTTIEPVLRDQSGSAAYEICLNCHRVYIPTDGVDKVPVLLVASRLNWDYNLDAFKAGKRWYIGTDSETALIVWATRQAISEAIATLANSSERLIPGFGPFGEMENKDLTTAALVVLNRLCDSDFRATVEYAWVNRWYSEDDPDGSNRHDFFQSDPRR